MEKLLRDWVKKLPIEEKRMTFYFHIPKVDDLLQMPEYFIGRRGWVREVDGCLYLIPDTYPNFWSSEIWVGVRQNTEEFVHCINPQFRRILDIQNEGILNLIYKEYAYPPFYKLYMRLKGKYGEPLAGFMTLKEIVDYCNNWCKALCDFPRKDFFDINLPITLDELMDHFRKHRDVAKELEEYLIRRIYLDSKSKK